jgi:hypothetical protein
VRYLHDSQAVRQKNMVMSPMGLRLKNDSAAKGQHQFTRTKPRTLGRSVIFKCSSQTPPLVEEEAPFQNCVCLGMKKNMVMGPSQAQNQE